MGYVVPVFLAACVGQPDPSEPPSGPPVDDGKGDTEAPAETAPPPPEPPPAGERRLRISPGGRLALATGEEVPLRVVVVDDAGAETDVTAIADYVVRNPLAAAVQDGTLVAGEGGSQATTVVARHDGLESPPLLVSTLSPMHREDFAAAREVWIDGTGVKGAPRVADGALALDLEAAAGARFQITLPVGLPMTNAERILFSWRYTGSGSFRVAAGSKNGDDFAWAVEWPTARSYGEGTVRHASVRVNPSQFVSSWDARGLVLDIHVDAAAKGTLVLDDIRVLRQFVLGVNLAWLDGAFGHDFGHDPKHPEWGVAYDPAHVDALLALAQANGVRLLRLWVFERCEGVTLDAEGVPTGLDPTLLENYDDFVRNRLPKYDVKVYLTLLGAASLDDCFASVLPRGRARDELVHRVLKPFVARYADSPWVWGIDIMNEPEGAVAGPSGNWSLGVSWDVMRDFLSVVARQVRTTAPHLFVSAGSGWHGAANVRDGKFSGLGFTHLDWHAYDDGGDIDDYPSLERRTRVLLGETGQEKGSQDDTLQAAVMQEMLSQAVAEHYWGMLPWYLDRPGSTNEQVLIDPTSTYGALRGRPALDVLRRFAQSRGDLGP